MRNIYFIYELPKVELFTIYPFTIYAADWSISIVDRLIVNKQWEFRLAKLVNQNGKKELIGFDKLLLLFLNYLLFNLKN